MPKFQRCPVWKTWHIKYEPFVNHEPMRDEVMYFNIQKWLLDIFDKRLKENTNTSYFFIHYMTNIPGVWERFRLHWFGSVVYRVPEHLWVGYIFLHAHSFPWQWKSCLPTLFSLIIASSERPAGPAWFRAVAPHPCLFLFLPSALHSRR